MFAMLTLAVSLFGQQLPADAPLLSKDKDLTCADWAKVANHYIALGEQKAIKELIVLASKESTGPTFFFNWNDQACHICRLLYVPKSGKKLRGPLLGGFTLPDDPSLQGFYVGGDHSSAGRWPEFPFAEQDGVWFFLVCFGYVLDGRPEPVASYINYCRTDGVFRTEPLSVPTSAQAKAALEKLLNSDRWSWHAFQETEGKRFLRRQAEF